MKKIILFWGLLAFCMGSSIFISKDVKAYDIVVKKDGIYSHNIPDEVFQGVDSCVKDFLDISAEKKKDTSGQEGIEIKKGSKVVVCKPYIVWGLSLGKGENSAETYYFIVVVDGKIIAILERLKAINTDGIGESFTMDSFWIEKLNELDYLHKDYVFYEYQGYTFAENAEESIQVDLYSNEYLYANDGGLEARKAEEESFQTLSYEEKVKKILQDMDNEAERFFGIQSTETPDAVGKKQEEKAKIIVQSSFLYVGLGIGVVIVVVFLWRFRKKKTV